MFWLVAQSKFDEEKAARAVAEVALASERERNAYLEGQLKSIKGERDRMREDLLLAHREHAQEILAIWKRLSPTAEEQNQAVTLPENVDGMEVSDLERTLRTLELSPAIGRTQIREKRAQIATVQALITKKKQENGSQAHTS